MPEAAVDEHYLSLLYEYEVRGAWQILSMQPEPVSQSIH